MTASTCPECGLVSDSHECTECGLKLQPDIHADLTDAQLLAGFKEASRRLAYFDIHTNPRFKTNPHTEAHELYSSLYKAIQNRGLFIPRRKS